MSLNRHVPRLFWPHHKEPYLYAHQDVSETGEEGGEGGGEPFAQQVNHRRDELKEYLSNDSFSREVRQQPTH